MDGSLPFEEHKYAEDHRAACLECREEVESLRALANVDEQEVAAATGLAPRLRSWFGGPLTFATAAAALLLSIGGLIWVANRGDESVLVGNAGNTANPPPVALDQPTPSAIEAPTQSVPEEGPTKGELATALRDGESVVGLDQAGNLVGLDAAPEKYRMQLKDALRSGKLPTADLSGLRSRSSATMGESDAPGESFEVVGPVGRVVDSGQPVLRWRPIAGVEGYSVDVFDDQYNKVASSGRLTATSWRARLPRGGTYVWQVTAYRDGMEIKAPRRPAPEARFRTLDTTRSAEIARLKRLGSHLALAVVYVDAGLLDDAERELRSLAAQNPRSALVKKFLEQIRARPSSR
jgi:hypothetical protein